MKKKKGFHKPCKVNPECLLNLPHSVCCSEKDYFSFFKYAKCVITSLFNTVWYKLIYEDSCGTYCQ